MMCDLADEIDDDLAVRVNGRRFLEPRDLADEGFVLEPDDDQEDVEDLHPAMLTLLQLDADQPGSNQAGARRTSVRLRPRTAAQSDSLERRAGTGLAIIG